MNTLRLQQRRALKNVVLRRKNRGVTYNALQRYISSHAGRFPCNADYCRALLRGLKKLFKKGGIQE
ncbi:hypothetical protein Tfer_0852 [Thermincola ferriacetica]|uniref:Uncharacterized protein n=1 Tax=Thermincola ferriacetica TaxID=281456 RepID=A0A0L6W3Y3_9FIRM|nr:hypothetical protein [Thermincola ferriacetica]KNZ70292.1 hypothetical protein Tfer_0852 [Thermincola ferriacetica]